MRFLLKKKVMLKSWKCIKNRCLNCLNKFSVFIKFLKENKTRILIFFKNLKGKETKRNPFKRKTPPNTK